MIHVLKVAEAYTLPPVLDKQTTYRLLPHDHGDAYYAERTNRNIGWITLEEQEVLRRSVVGIAGCGGMGGLVAATLARLGVGELRIADCEAFDISNLNRQFAANRDTIGKSKAFETARMVRDITDDMTLVVYPQGITEETSDNFLDGCDIVCDEIEFWAVGARILLHQTARYLNIPIMNCSTVGFGTRLFFFDHKGMGIGDMLGFSLTRANLLQERLAARTATQREIDQVLQAMLIALIPELPNYRRARNRDLSTSDCLRRLREERIAPIIASNPPLASGFLADHVVLTLLKRAGLGFRSIGRMPPTPGYLYFDAATMKARKVFREELSHAYTI